MYIELNNITKSIKGTTVLEDISLRFEGGSVYGLKGKNGCGKTMLMRTICGLIKPTQGTVDINGKQLWKDMTFPESIGALIENPSFIDRYTGFDNLKMLANIKGIISDEQICDALRSVGLDPADTRKYRKYSLGMKQKLGIACAVMENPDIVILDEPINAIDADGALLVHDILDKLKKLGKIIIIACHDADEMDALADKIILMEQGRIIGNEDVMLSGKE